MLRVAQVVLRVAVVVLRVAVVVLYLAAVLYLVEDLVAPFLYRRLVTQVRITRGQVDDLHTELLERWS